MHTLKSKIGLLLIAFVCAYTVDGISQSEKSNSKKEVVIIKKSIDDNGDETVEKKVFTGDDLSEKELQQLIEAETNSEVDLNIWTTDDGEEMEITVDDTEHLLFMEDDEIQKFLLEKGLSMDEIVEMNINVDSESVDGKEHYHKTVTVLDDKGKKHEFNIDAEQLQEIVSHDIHSIDDHKPKLGVMIEETEDVNGVLVTYVVRNSPAQKAGLKSGDVIYALGEQHVKTIDDLLSALKVSGSKNVISFRRNDEVKTASVEFNSFEHKNVSKQKIRKKMIIKNEER